MRIRLMRGLSRGDLLRLRLDQHIKDDGVHVQRHKTARATGKRRVYGWTPDLRDAVDRPMRGVQPSPFLFCAPAQLRERRPVT